MQPVMSEEESDQYLTVLMLSRRVLVIMFSHAQVPNHVCIYVGVCVSVAVYKTHVELQVKVHTLVYICTYKHPEGISTISPKYCTYLQQEYKRKYFQYISGTDFNNYQSNTINGQIDCSLIVAGMFHKCQVVDQYIYSFLLPFCYFKSVSYKFLF